MLAPYEVDTVYASPLLRSYQTALIMAAPHGLEVRQCDAILEVDVGDWEGRSWDDIQQSDPEAYRFVAGKIGVAPEKILFFDDNGEKIEGARAAGLNAVQVRSPSDIEQALAGVGALNRGAG